MMTLVAVGLPYILNSNSFPLLWIEMSRKLILLSFSASNVNLILEARLLNAL